jgi:hypothetical protein
VHQLLAPTGVLAHLSTAQVSVLTGRQFFPQLISGPFHHGLVIVFSMAMALLVIAAFASLLRGGRYVHEETNVAAGDQPTMSGGQPATRGGQQATASEGQVTANGARPATNNGQPSGLADGGEAPRARRGRATPELRRDS